MLQTNKKNTKNIYIFILVTDRNGNYHCQVKRDNGAMAAAPTLSALDFLDGDAMPVSKKRATENVEAICPASLNAWLTINLPGWGYTMGQQSTDATVMSTKSTMSTTHVNQVTVDNGPPTPEPTLGGDDTSSTNVATVSGGGSTTAKINTPPISGLTPSVANQVTTKNPVKPCGMSPSGTLLYPDKYVRKSKKKKQKNNNKTKQKKSKQYKF